MTPAPGRVVAVCGAKGHGFSKPVLLSIRLLPGLGVAGDAHAGATVQHRSRVARDPTQPNLRQVHLIHAELFAELAGAGFDIHPGQIGENITTRGIDLLALPAGARLHLGNTAVVEVTGIAQSLFATRSLPARPDGGGAAPRPAGRGCCARPG